MKKLFFALLILVFSVVIFAPTAFASSKTVEFAWSQVVSLDLEGWKLYKSLTAGGPYDFVADIMYVTEQSEYTSEQVIVAPDNAEIVYYFVLTAFDTRQNESDYSNEVSDLFDFLAPAAPFVLTITVVTP